MKALAPITTGYEWMMADFRASAVPDRLTLANVKWVEGDEAIQPLIEHKAAQLQRVTSYMTMPVIRLRQSREFADAGGWMGYGCGPDGEPGQVAYFKPRQPRKEFDNGRLKPLKYEGPIGMPALPLLPLVDEVSAAAIYDRHQVQPLPGENFWQCVYRCNLPVAITEGLKKALALIAHGLPAIAVRGITQWHKKDTREPHDEIAHFATPGRQMYIAYDADNRPRQLKDLRRETLNLGAALEQAGCLVRVLTWDYQLGKGIDDVLAAKGSEAQSWLDQLITSCPSLDDYRRYGRLAAAIAAISRHNQLSYPRERVTTGPCIVDLPEIERNAIHLVLGATGTRKTTVMGRDWVQAVRAKGEFALVLSPTNALGQQTAKKWGLPHMHDFGTSPEQQNLLLTQARVAGGMVLCPNSLHRVSKEVLQQRVLHLVLDEANQVINHLCSGETLGARLPEILEIFAAVAQHARKTGSIIMAEAGLPDRAVKIMQAVSGCKKVRVFEHRTDSDRYPVTILDGPASAFRAGFLEKAGDGKRRLLPTSSQREGRRMEKAIKQRYRRLKVVRIDSETNEDGRFNSFFEDPDAWLQEHQPDVLILSPSVKSGVSIEAGVSVENAYFDEVWGYFPSLATDTHLQMLGRFRPAVPRFVYVPPFIQTGGDEALGSPGAVRRRQQLNLKGLAGAFDLEELLASGDRAEQLVQIETAVLDYLAVSKTVEGLQKSIARDALTHDLEAAGHKVSVVKVKGDKAIAKLWKEITEEIARFDAQEIAQLQPPDGQTVEKAGKVLASGDTKRLDRLAARKTLWRDEFPGVTFDDQETCYQALTRDYGAMRRGVLLQGRAENLAAVKATDAAAAARILGADIRALHHLPKNYVRALLISKTGILQLLDGQAWSNTDARAIAVKRAALRWAKEISYWLRLQIDEAQTASEVCNKLIRRFGLKAVAISRPGRRNEVRDRQWGIEDADNPVRAQLLEALRRKLSGSVSTICNKENTPIQIMDTPPPGPPNPPPDTGLQPGAAVRWAAAGLTGRLVTLAGMTATFEADGGGRFYLPLGELQAG